MGFGTDVGSAGSASPDEDNPIRRDPGHVADVTGERPIEADVAGVDVAAADAAGGGPSESAVTGADVGRDRRHRKRERADNMLPGRERRRLGIERLLVRLVATSGVVGIGVALGAILVSSKVQGWITGLVVAVVSVVLSAILWSSRQV